MRTYNGMIFVGAMLLAAPLAAQSEPTAQEGTATEAEATETVSTQAEIVIQHMRPHDQRGLNVFEAPKDDGVPFTGFRLDWGAALHAAVPGARSQQHGRTRS